MLLDKHLEGMAPEDIRAATMPTMEELQREMDQQGAQWVKDALATDPGKYHPTLVVNYDKSRHVLNRLNKRTKSLRLYSNLPSTYRCGRGP